MQSKHWAGGLAGGVGLTSFVLMVWSGFRGLVGLFGDVQAASDMVALVETWPINWIVVYILAFLISMFWLIAIYWGEIRNFCRKFEAPKGIYWNLSITEAVIHVGSRSHFARTINSQRRIDIAVDAIKEAAIQKRIKTAGRKAGCASLSLIKPSDWKHLLVEVKLAVNSKSGHDGEWINLIHPKTGSIVFEGIMLNKTDVRSEWPAPGDHDF